MLIVVSAVNTLRFGSPWRVEGLGQWRFLSYKGKKEKSKQNHLAHHTKPPHIFITKWFDIFFAVQLPFVFRMSLSNLMVRKFILNLSISLSLIKLKVWVHVTADVSKCYFCFVEIGCSMWSMHLLTFGCPHVILHSFVAYFLCYHLKMPNHWFMLIRR